MSGIAVAREAEKKRKASNRRNARQAVKDGVPPQARKRGNPGNFSGARLTFLEKAEADYLKTTGRGKISMFLSKFMYDWWAAFPWYQDLDPVDPVGVLKGAKRAKGVFTGEGTLEGLDTIPPEASLDEGTGLTATATEITDSADSAMATAETAAARGKRDIRRWATGGVDPGLRTQIEEIYGAQIKSWFAHRKTVANRSEKNPFKEWLRGFQKPPAAPRKQAVHKFYMHDGRYAKKVDELFQKMWPTADLEQRFELDFRCKCAKTLFDKEPQEVQKRLEEDVEEVYKKAMDAHEQKINAIGKPAHP
ncbi:hypothetical protein B0H11DRAFT_1945837 [Mycena galericulata]|nr:hypothetical protein B0H11DRAFT_1945837 [Mycena galericulata]